ncbi:hypothetical protein ACFXJ6_03010 [Streptomyces sp. NPDC059218]|uniref:hypothetical protein n=1 Tax=Streptomyces sp. NPDC059218 TaxID=3346773 RepID=UPI0036CC3656
MAGSPAALTALTVEGAAHLLRLVWGRAVAARRTDSRRGGAYASGAQVMPTGLAISGLNPKALLLHFSLFIRAGTAGWSPRRPGCSARCAPDRLRRCLPSRRHPGPNGFQTPFLGGPGHYLDQRCHGDCHRHLPAGGSPDRLRNPPAPTRT